MFSIYQIAGFLNQLYLQNKMMKFPVFFACRYKFMRIKFWLKILREGMLKNGLHDSKLDCRSVMDGWNKLIFCLLIQI